jgi:hypothetical protein
MYISQSLQGKKRRVEIIPAAFTDHHALILRMEINNPTMPRGRGFWKMNTTLLREKNFQQILKGKWEIWKTHKKYYPDRLIWWERYIKRTLRKTFVWEGTDRRRDRPMLENFYCEAINSLLNTPNTEQTTVTKMKHLKAKLKLLHHEEQQQLFLNTGEQERIGDENPTLYHFIGARKRHITREIQQITDKDGVTHDNNWYTKCI